MLDPCKSCHGHGQVRRERTLEVRIPPGVDDGARIRLAGEGDAGARGGPRGDLYIFLSVKPHELFERDGLDLLCSVPVPMAIAALGGAIEAPCLLGGENCDGECKIEVKVPEGAQTGRTVRLKGRGMPSLRSRERGDLVVELFIETPTKLTARQKELLREFAGLCGEQQHPRQAALLPQGPPLLGRHHPPELIPHDRDPRGAAAERRGGDRSDRHQLCDRRGVRRRSRPATASRCANGGSPRRSPSGSRWTTCAADERPWSHGFVAEDGGVCVGFAAAVFEPWNKRLVLWHLYVQPSARGRGTARRLVERVADLGHDLGARHIWLETSNLNVPGVAAYRALGFSLTGIDATLYDSTPAEGEIALFFSRPIQ